MDPANPRCALDNQAAAAYVGLSPYTLENLRSRGGGPAYSKLGRRVIYRIEDLDAWLLASRRTSTSDTCGADCRCA